MNDSSRVAVMDPPRITVRMEYLKNAHHVTVSVHDPELRTAPEHDVLGPILNILNAGKPNQLRALPGDSVERRKLHNLAAIAKKMDRATVAHELTTHGPQITFRTRPSYASS
ncbi:MAG: hypothetical protein RL681_132 [Candidatus Parcubacteria bacterium]|jgi:hypothetical protein